MNQRRTNLARHILKDVVYSTIATCSADGWPWAAPQFTVYDAKTNAMYWCAAKDSQHAVNIRRNGRAFIVVYNSMAAPGEGEGVYLQTQATQVEDDKTITYAHDLLLKRHSAPYWKREDLGKDSPVGLYKAIIEKAWVNEGREVQGHFVIERVLVEL